LISFSWFEPANGGANIDDYQVFVCQHDQEINCSFELLASTTGGLREYTAVALTKGETYQFKVRAHNSIGYGSLSDALAVVAADKPNQPLNVQNVESSTDRTQITIVWTEPV
jgi:hypothetical protein